MTTRLSGFCRTFRTLPVVQWRAPLGGALKDGHVPDRLGHFGDGLYPGSSCADHRDPLAGEADRFLRPVMSVAGLALERVDTGNARHGRRRQHADCGDQEARGVAAAVVEEDVPTPRVLPV